LDEMATLKLGNKVVATQTGTNNPVINSATSFAGTVSSSATFPAGHIVQVVNTTMNPIDEDVSYSTSYFEPGSTTNNGEMSRTITPKVSGNKLLVITNYMPRGRAPSGQDMYFAVELQGGPTGSMTQQWEITRSSDNLGKLGDTVIMPCEVNKSYFFTTASTAEHKFTLKVKTSSSTGVYYRSGGGDITIMEIQA
tara:strand:+ start:382 stop:966 length:585 start_codon:yes stop_codon:yes gene_type:complete